jgi:hypothetical protein
MNKKSGPAIVFVLYILFAIASPRAMGLAQEINEGNKEPAPVAHKATTAEIQPARMAGLVKTMAIRKVFNTRETWRASAYGTRFGTKDGHKWGPARLCFTSGPSLNDGHCYQAKDGKDVYETVKEMSLVPMYNEREPAYALYFVASAANNRRLASLWTYRKEERRFANIVPPLAYPDRAGGYYFLPDVRPDMGRLIVLVDSDDPASAENGRDFACRIRVFRYSDKSRRFEPVGPGYTTTTKYEYFLLEPEMENIKKYLAGKLPSPVPEGTKEKDAADYLVDTLPLGRVFNISKEWQATTYNYLDPDPAHQDVGPPAKICFSGPGSESCFEAVTGTGENKWVYNMGGMSLVPLFSDGEPAFGVLYNAGGVAWGRDLGNLVTLWTYNRERQEFVNVLPPLAFSTDLGSSALLSDVHPGMEGIFAMADYIQGEDEARMDYHRYRISLYRYSRKSGMFEPAGSFVTKDKYGESNLKVIFQSEMRGIERLLRKK